MESLQKGVLHRFSQTRTSSNPNCTLCEPEMTKKISDLIENRFGAQTNTGAELPAVGSVAALLERRTHRQYTEQPIEDELLDVLLACGLSASSKSDLQ
ncbi:MAG: hypothetical protein ACI9ON_001584, partial [Limisphaerales bacterium]